MSNPSTAFITAVYNKITSVVAEKTLIDLTNQRAKETPASEWSESVTYEAGSVVEHDDEVWYTPTSTTGDEPGEDAPWVVYAPVVEVSTLTDAIEMAAAEVGEHIALSPTDMTAVKFTIELTLADLAMKFGRSMSDLGISSKEDTMRRLESVRMRRLKRKPILTSPLSVCFPEKPSDRSA